MMVESDCRVKSFHVININDNIVDNLLQQLGNGDLRTQVRLGVIEIIFGKFTEKSKSVLNSLTI